MVARTQQEQSNRISWLYREITRLQTRISLGLYRPEEEEDLRQTLVGLEHEQSDLIRAHVTGNAR